MVAYPTAVAHAITQRVARTGRTKLEPVAGALSRAADALVLGAVWAVLSLGIVTILPASAASVRIVAAWIRDEPTSWRAYGTVLRRSLIPSLIITPGIIVAALALINSGLLARAAPGGRFVEWIVWGSLACASAVFVTTCVWIAPVMATHRLGGLATVRTAWAWSVRAPIASLACALAMAAAALIVVFWPPLVVFIVAPVCWLLVRTADRHHVATKG